METLDELTDERLADRVRRENKELFSVIVDRYERRLLRYAGVLVRDGTKAQDVVQSAFIKAYMNLNGFNTRKKFSSWIYRIVHNEAVNEIKKFRSEMPLYTGTDAESGENIEESYTKKEVVRMARLCLSRIPVLYSEPLSLYYMDDKSYEEISDILRIPMGTVATRISRAKAAMKTVCQKSNNR